ncbi:MAG: glutamate racemase [Candidatus Krumholzibacteriia bacterium]|jgi:glutamate racemase
MISGVGRSSAPIGVFDSGLGGLTVLRALNAHLPAEDLIYFGDTARVPYGTKGEKTVRSFACQDSGLLVSQGVKMVVVACNTASAFALEYLREILPVPVIGVINPGVRAALAVTGGGPIGVIGTAGTIRSQKYQAGLLAGGLSNAQIISQECPLFVPLVEEGMQEHQITSLAVAEYLSPLKDAGVDTLILGCTHYPLLAEQIGAFMGPDVKLVDSAESLANAAQTMLREHDLLRAQGASDTRGNLSFLLSDIPWKFKEIGARFLGMPLENMQTVGLDQMEAAGRVFDPS